jgi:hypothetical protein
MKRYYFLTVFATICLTVAIAFWMLIEKVMAHLLKDVVVLAP